MIDLIVFVGYFFVMIGFGIWIVNKDKMENVQDYFLVSKVFFWWVVGGLFIVLNIFMEQILGMNGLVFELGLVIVFYELMVVVMLFIVVKFFFLVYLKQGIYIMLQFLE